MKRIEILYIGIFVLLTSLGVVSCTQETYDEKGPVTEQMLDATFAIEELSANNFQITANSSEYVISNLWDLGDGTGYVIGSNSFELFLPDAGEYEIKHRIIGAGGIYSGEELISVSVTEDIVLPNLIENGGFDDDQLWTILPISDGIEVSFTDGKAVWTGNDGQVGIYQEVQVEANQAYQIDMDISGSGSTDTWFEVYLGMAVPVAGSDYTDGGTLLGLSTWNGCGTSEFDSKFTAVSCAGEAGGAVEFTTSGSAYLVIRGGGNLGTISIDNVEVNPVD